MEKHDLLAELRQYAEESPLSLTRAEYFVQRFQARHTNDGTVFRPIKVDGGWAVEQDIRVNSP